MTPEQEAVAKIAATLMAGVLASNLHNRPSDLDAAKYVRSAAEIVRATKMQITE